MSERILVTAAGGFIGGRLAEVLFSEGMDVVATVHRWSTAARIARFPMTIKALDVSDRSGVFGALRGVDVVVNCATGSGDLNRTSIRHILDGAVAAGVKRVVHISSVAVYGDRDGVLDESTPPTYSGSEYGDSKLDAETVCAEYNRTRLPVVVLRPTIVYGPFNQNWTVDFANRMAAGRWPFPREECNGICNLVYVDDLVNAIVLAMRLSAREDTVYNINGPEFDLTWNDYFDALAAALGLGPLQARSRAAARTMTALVQPVRKTAKLLLKQYQPQVMRLYHSSTAVQQVMKFTESMIRRTPSAAEYGLYGRRLIFPNNKAEAGLGYLPRIDMKRGVELSAAWLRHQKYV
jgi:nucleoside-diphosphate-sugar epimerase